MKSSSSSSTNSATTLLRRTSLLGSTDNNQVQDKSPILNGEETIVNGNTNNSSNENGSNISDDDANNIDQRQEERTLYDVLGGTPEMTRAQLKKCYAEKAKLSHPDARIGSTATVGDGTDDHLDFVPIANAWSVLGNSKLRKRYDRELKAKEWSARAQKLTNERLEKGFGVASNLMDNVAVPFLRRTTETTLAVGQALSGLNNNNDNGSRGLQSQVNITETFLSVIGRRSDGGQSIDTGGLNEKSEALERRVKEEEERASQITEELNQLTKERLLATLQSPTVALTSDEAQTLLERLDINDTVSLVDRAMLKTTVEKEISGLKETEELFSEKLKLYDETDQEWTLLLEKQEIAKDELLQKKNFEIEARKTLEKAQQSVVDAKESLVQTSNELRSVEQHVRKTAQEMDQITTRLTRRQEKVRDALRKKTEMMESGIQVKYLEQDELASLRKKELQLLNERQEAQEMVTRLQSRADKLRNRAEALDSWKTKS